MIEGEAGGVTRPGDTVQVAGLAALAGTLAAIGTLAGHQTTPVLPLGVAAAAGVLVLAVARPLWVVQLAIIAIPLELFTVSLGPAGLSATEALMAAAGLGWAVRRLSRHQAPFVGGPLSGPAILLVASVVPALGTASESFPIVRILLMWSAFALVFFMIVEDGTEGTVRRVLGLLALAGAVVAVVSAVRSGGQAPVVDALGDTAAGRAVGAFGDPNILGSFLALALPGAVVLGVAGPPAWRPFALAACVAMLSGLALSLSRGGLVAAGGALLVLLGLRRVRWVAVVGGVVVAVILASPANPLAGSAPAAALAARVQSVRSAGQSQTDQRLEIYRTTPRIVAAHPLFGVGANQFSAVAPNYGLVDPVTGETFDHAHDIALTIAAELGLLGLGALVWLVLALVLTLRRALRSDRTLALAVAAAFFGLALQGLVDYTLRSNVIASLVAVLAGCAMVLSRPAALLPEGGHRPDGARVEPRASGA